MMEEIKIAIRLVTIILGIYLYSWVCEYLRNNENENEYLFWSWIFINVLVVIMIIFWAFS